MYQTSFDFLFEEILKKNDIKLSKRMVAKEIDGELHLACTVAGHDPKNVDVQLWEDKIQVKAETKHDGSLLKYVSQDFDLIHYIPEQYDGSTAKAEIKNGVLLVTISKREELKPKKLSIRF
jgi:HSP20 family molecular chaperone IbpA